MLKFNKTKGVEISISSINEYKRAAAICKMLGINWASGHDPTEFIAEGLEGELKKGEECVLCIDYDVTWGRNVIDYARVFSLDSFEKASLYSAKRNNNYIPFKIKLNDILNKMVGKENFEYC